MISETQCFHDINGHAEKKGGAAWGTRTHDPIITNDVLYHLS